MRLSGFHQARESLGIVNSQLGKHLAVYLYAGIFKAVNKLAVADAVDAGRSIDTRNPQGTEISLLELSANKGISLRFHNCLICYTELLAFCAVVAFGQLQYLFTIFIAVNGSFNSHGLLSSRLIYTESIS